MAELNQRPFYQKAKEVLGAQFVKADDGFGTATPLPGTTAGTDAATENDDGGSE